MAHLVRNAVALALVTLPAMAIAWFQGTTTENVAVAAPWVIGSFLTATFLLPQQRPAETFFGTFKRSIYLILRDPAIYLALAFIALLGIALFNPALCPSCDWEAIDAGANPYPRWRALPFCVNLPEHRMVILHFAQVLACALAVRHALTRDGKRAFFEAMVWNGAALALFGFVQMAFGAKAPFWRECAHPVHFFSVFGYPNHAGAFFTLAYACSLGLWCLRMEKAASRSIDDSPLRHPLIARHYPLPAVALSMFAVLATLSRAAMFLSVILTFLFMGRTALVSISRRSRSLRATAISGIVLMLALIGAIFVYAPPEVGRELATLNLRALADRTSGRAQYHNRIATSIMRDFPFCGVGGWGYRHFARSYMTEAESAHAQIDGGANVHNDYLQFLAEHGLAGFALLAACIFLLVKPVAIKWRDTVARERFSEKTVIMKPVAVFAVEPTVFLGALGCVAIFVHAFGDCPLRSTAVFTCLLSALAALIGFLPHDRH